MTINNVTDATFEGCTFTSLDSDPVIYTGTNKDIHM